MDLDIGSWNQKVVVFIHYIVGVLQLICEWLGKLVPIKVKEIYFQHLQHQVKAIMDFIHLKVGRSKAIRLSKVVIGNDMNCHEDFLRNLGFSPRDAAYSMDQSDVIIVFVPIVSRAGTDIDTALKKIPGNCPAVAVVLHHTYDPDYIFPDSRRAVSRSNVFAVDCLFHEDSGLLKCHSNTKALEATEKYLRDIKTN